VRRPCAGGALEALRGELAARGLRLARRLGQHVLIDPNLNSAIARAALGGEQPAIVLEVGPGTGALTGALLEAGARVLAVELDRGLAGFLRERFAGALASEGPGSLALLECDILARGAINPAACEAISVELDRSGRDSFRVAANLPYNAASRFLLALAGSGLRWSGGAVVVQSELARRLAARPGSGEYGAVSACWQLLARGRVEREIGREVFWPRPRVESALLAIEPRRDGRGAGPAEAAPLGEFLKRLFSQRRKVLKTALARAAGLSPEEADAALVACGLDGLARAETLRPEELLALWRTAEDHVRRAATS